MTSLDIGDEGVDVIYQGTAFRLEKSLIEEATGKSYFDVTDHEILRIIERDPSLDGAARRVGDILG